MLAREPCRKTTMRVFAAVLPLPTVGVPPGKAGMVMDGLFCGVWARTSAVRKRICSASSCCR